MEQQRRVHLQWTETAKRHLAALPSKVRRGLLDKANRLRETDDPTAAGKALTGPLRGYYRIVYARYRLIYTVDEEVLANDERRVCVRVLFVAAGIRKELDKRNVYKVAERLVELGLITFERGEAKAQDDASSAQEPG